MPALQGVGLVATRPSTRWSGFASDSDDDVGGTGRATAGRCLVASHFVGGIRVNVAGTHVQYSSTGVLVTIRVRVASY